MEEFNAHVLKTDLIKDLSGLTKIKHQDKK
jgi:hypothetical protein